MEGILQGHQVLAAEINPISRLIAKVKTTIYDVNMLLAAAEALLKSITANISEPEIPEFPNRDLWFSTKVQSGLARVKAGIETFQEKPLRDFFWVCYSSLIRRVALADPRVSPPVFLRADKFKPDSARYKKICQMIEDRANADVESLFARVLEESIKRFQRLLEASKDKELGEAKVVWDDARTLGVAPMLEKGLLDKTSAEEFTPNSVDLLITSPPYMNAQKYARSLRLEWFWLGMGSYAKFRAMDASMIGTERLLQDEYSELKTTSHVDADELIMKAFALNKHRARLMANYFDDMRICFKNFYRVIKPGGYFVLIVGNNRVFTHRIPNHKILGDFAVLEGFKLVCTFVDRIKSRGLMTKRNITADIIPDEWVLVLKK